MKFCYLVKLNYYVEILFWCKHKIHELFNQTMKIDTHEEKYFDSCYKSNYHTIMAMMAPLIRLKIFLDYLCMSFSGNKVRQR
jgi:hypothetical protein